MKRISVLTILLFGMISVACAGNNGNLPAISTDAGNANLTLPKGFSATVVADGYGKVRHIAVTSTGGVYVKLNKLYNGKGILYFKPNAAGKLEMVNSFGNYIGTGIYVKNGYLYASSDEEVFRYKLNDKEDVINPDQPEKIVTGLLNRHQHESKSIVLDNEGNL
ncbi:MAG: sorbosone dehydrogenase, partial [Bacteroidota bacterium]|nr:sorbosone dehydrogenase [Bacteroidota bacterium]